MEKIAQKKEKIKTISELLQKDEMTKLAMIKHCLELNVMLINELLEDEVTSLAGDRYSREKPHDGRYSRWGTNPGSVRIGEEKVKINVPRVYDNQSHCNTGLENYKSLRDTEPDEYRLMKGVLNGLSTSDYKEVISHFIDSFGLSRSSVSNRFIEQSSELVKEFSERDLSCHDFIALVIDGKYLAREQMVIALGITHKGEKIPLGFIQTSTENARSIKQLLSDLISRGFSYDDGIFCIIDGAKGLHKALVETFGNKAVIQRCQWHKLENILSYLKESDKDKYRKRLNEAYATQDYNEALNKLEDIWLDLEPINISAANSLKEGLEETLTIHRLGLKKDFGRSFSTTNVIENVNSQIKKYLGRVKYWKTSDQRRRWLACALLEAEKKMRKVDNFRNLHLLKETVRKEIEKRNQ
ncbi:MAG: IS256 family transposase [bacterium]